MEEEIHYVANITDVGCYKKWAKNVIISKIEICTITVLCAKQYKSVQISVSLKLHTFTVLSLTFAR